MKSSHIGCDGYVEEENGIARIIGNVPIAHYDGSPRRYGAKPHVLATQQQQQQQQQQRHIHSTPGYPQRIINSVDLSVGLSDSTSESKGLADISCDEIVKSILSIPIAGEISPTDSNGSKSEFESSPISEHNSDNHDVNNMNIYHFSDLDYKLYAMNAKRVSSVSSSDDRCFDDSPTKSLNNDLLAHENELIILHESVRQHIFNEMVSVSVDREDVMTAHRTNTEAQTQVCDEAKNFTISPDITDCDSNEIESEISLEGSTVSNSKIMPHMPILEDGLSSGVPSSDNELEDDSNLYSVSFSRVKTKTYHNQHNQQDIVDTLEKNDCLNAILPNGSNYNQNKSESNSNSFHEEQNIDEPDGDKTINLNISEHPLKETNDVNERNTDQPISYESIWIPMSNDATTCATSTSIIEGDKTNCNLNSSHIPHHHDDECDTDQETDRLLGAQRNDDERGFFDEKERPDSSLGSMSSLFKLPKRNINSYVKLENFIDDQQNNANKRTNATREVLIREPSVLIEGVLFRARYLGSTQLICEGQPTKATRMMQAEEAVSRIKAPEGETQPSTDVDLFISTEKIMVLNTDLKEIMMDHALRTISYIADIGDLLVLMARRRILNNIEDSSDSNLKRIPKMICHVFESEEAQFIAQSIGQAFQVAYMEFLKANGIEDSSFVKEMDYQEVLNSQEIFGNELEMFAKKEKQKEVIVPKQKGEILGMVIVESGWGSMLPTVVIANMAQQSPSARCGQLNIGDQIIAINGVSLVGLPLSTCQAYIKNTKNQTVVKFTVVPCAPVVEVKIKRPDTKYQLGFSVQNGVICSLLRGGIAERGGVRVGHRIIEINGQSVVAVPHDRIVNLLATSVGEVTRTDKNSYENYAHFNVQIVNRSRVAYLYVMTLQVALIARLDSYDGITQAVVPCLPVFNESISDIIAHRFTSTIHVICGDHQII